MPGECQHWRESNAAGTLLKWSHCAWKEKGKTPASLMRVLSGSASGTHRQGLDNKTSLSLSLFEYYPCESPVAQWGELAAADGLAILFCQSKWLSMSPVKGVRVEVSESRQCEWGRTVPVAVRLRHEAARKRTARRADTGGTGNGRASDSRSERKKQSLADHCAISSSISGSAPAADAGVEGSLTWCESVFFTLARASRLR